MATTFSDPHKREFAKIFDSLCGAHSRWEVWGDFISLAAYDISNAVDAVHREKREEYREAIAKRYTPEELNRFAQLFTVTVDALDRNMRQDFLGSLLMQLELGNKNAGQFFTPYHLCEATAEVVGAADTLKAHLSSQGWISVSDPCVGGGAMLIAFANHCLRHEVNYQQKILFVGQDLDPTVAKAAYIQLSLIGAAGYIVIGDTLSEPAVSPHGTPLFAPMDRETFITPMFCSNVWTWRRRAYLMDQMFKETHRQEYIPDRPVRKRPKLSEQSDPESAHFEPVQLSFFDVKEETA